MHAGRGDACPVACSLGCEVPDRANRKPKRMRGLAPPQPRTPCSALFLYEHSPRHAVSSDNGKCHSAPRQPEMTAALQLQLIDGAIDQLLADPARER